MNEDMMVYPTRGSATFACRKCTEAETGRQVTIAWEAGYPPVEVPTCENGHGALKRVDGDDHTKLITDDELLEAEVRAELESKQRIYEREARKSAIRERLLAQR